MILAILAACSGNIGVINADQGSEKEQNILVQKHDTAAPEDTGDDSVDCDEQGVYPLGMTLNNLPPSLGVKITATDEDGNVVYTETVDSDTCGVATPFQSVSVEDFGSFRDDYDHGVYAMTGSEATGYVQYTGILLSDDESQPAETPISTQWTWDEEAGATVAIHDPNLGVMIGVFMIP